MSLKRERALSRLRRLRSAIEHEGLPAQPNIYHVAALTGSLIEILGRTDDPTRASAAAEYLYRLASASFRASGVEARLACKRGCSYCCHGYVSATAPQIFAAAQAMRTAGSGFDAAWARIGALAQATRGLGWDARCRMRRPCGLLADGACEIYARRPLACRGFASYSAASCQRSFERQSDDVLIPPQYANVRSALENALRAALKRFALPATSYELNAALASALEQPDAEARWLRGEAVFDPIDAERPGAAAIEFQRELMLDTLLAIARGESPAHLQARGQA